MSPEELQQILELYGLVSRTPGKTTSQQLSNLSNAGFNLFDPPKQFIPEQFIGTPEPELVNPIAEVYGKSPIWRSIFSDIENRGMSPEEAVQARIDSEEAPESWSMTNPDAVSGSNPFFIAKDFAIKDAENRAALNAWASKNAAEGQQFQTTQDRLRAEFEQKQPYGVKDLLGTTEYEEMGAPSVDQLMQVRSNRRSEARSQLPQPVRTSNSKSVKAAAPQRAPRKDIFDQPILSKLLRSGLEGRLSNASRTRVPTARSQEALRNLAMVQLLSQ